jgi:phosphotransferase system HPr (HPr) family protein
MNWIREEWRPRRIPDRNSIIMAKGRVKRNGGTSRGGSNRGEVPEPAAANPVPTPPQPIRRTVRVVNPRGLHPRIIDFFTKTAKKFHSAVTVWNGDMRADGKSMFDLILLVVLPQTDVVLEVEGPDAAAAFESLARVLGSESGEDYTI